MWRSASSGVMTWLSRPHDVAKAWRRRSLGQALGRGGDLERADLPPGAPLGRVELAVELARPLRERARELRAVRLEAQAGRVERGAAGVADRPLVDDDDVADAGQREVVRGGAADDARADHDDVRALLHAPAALQMRTSSRSSPPSPTTRSVERQAEQPRGVLGGAAQRRRRALRQPHAAAVGVEVVVAQLGIAVEAERAPDRVLERAREEVGEEVRARLLGQRLVHLVEAEEVVARVAARGARSRCPRAPRRARRSCRSRRRPPRRARGGPRSSASFSVTAGAMRSGRLCSCGGSAWTSRSRPRRRAIARTCSASAPQATTPTVMPGT